MSLHDDLALAFALLNTRVLIIAHAVPQPFMHRQCSRQKVLLCFLGEAHGQQRQDGGVFSTRACSIQILRGIHHSNNVQVACSQCLRGRVVLEAYSVGKALHDAGVVRWLTCRERCSLWSCVVTYGRFKSPPCISLLPACNAVTLHCRSARLT